MLDVGCEETWSISGEAGGGVDEKGGERDGHELGDTSRGVHGIGGVYVSQLTSMPLSMEGFGTAHQVCVDVN